MIKDRSYKLIVIGMLIIFAVGLFFSVRFLRSQISLATEPLRNLAGSATTLDMDAWDKIKHRFIQ